MELILLSNRFQLIVSPFQCVRMVIVTERVCVCVCVWRAFALRDFINLLFLTHFRLCHDRATNEHDTSSIWARLLTDSCGLGQKAIARAYTHHTLSQKKRHEPSHFTCAPDFCTSFCSTKLMDVQTCLLRRPKWPISQLPCHVWDHKTCEPESPINGRGERKSVKNDWTRWAKCFIDMYVCNAQRYVWCQMKRMSWNIFCTLHMYVGLTVWLCMGMIRRDFHQISSHLILIYICDGGHGTQHTAYTTLHTWCVPACVLALFIFRFFLLLNGWRLSYKMISVSSTAITERIGYMYMPRRASTQYTCDLVVAYIHIHMLLMPGINNVLHFTVHPTSDGVRKDTRKSSRAHTPAYIVHTPSHIAPNTLRWTREFVVFVFVFLLASVASESATRSAFA